MALRETNGHPLLAMALALVGVFAVGLFQLETLTAQVAAPVATRVQVARTMSLTGMVIATVGGRPQKIADDAWNAWRIEGGRAIVYSGKDGAGGYEGEGQSLYRYDVKTGKRRKVVAEYYMIRGVTEVKTRTGRTVLLLEMMDGGLGATHLAVVDPTRGEVWRAQIAKVVNRKGDMMTVGYYRSDDVGEEDQGRAIKPFKTLRFDLVALLKRPILTNKPSP